MATGEQRTLRQELLRHVVLLVSVLLASSACTGRSEAGATGPSSPPTITVQPGFDDHTLPDIDSLETFSSLARRGVGGQSVTKFVVPDFHGGAEVIWFDTNFYQLHDEWFWFRLLNGQTVPGVDIEPVEGLHLETIDAVYEWAGAIDDGDLPLGLRWISSRTFGRERLYAPLFYDQALEMEPRNYGVGSLVHIEGEAGIERWLIELEYSDDPTPDEIALFFQRLLPTLPEAIADDLAWVTRSPAQDATASRMENDRLPYHDRIVRADELIDPGQVLVYNEGVAAGRLLLVSDERAQLTDTRETDVLLLERVPDWLPPAAALITATPQTPLAHVNLLARNRGIPNASLAGLLDEPGIVQAARGRAFVVVRASDGDQLEVALVTEEEYLGWQALLSKRPIGVPPVDVDSLPVLVDLNDLAGEIETDADIGRWRPIIGGKAAGFLNLLAADATAPPNPLVITVAPYFNHVDQLDRILDAMLDNHHFRRSARARFLLLEGPDRYVETYADPDDVEFLARFEEENPPASTLGELLAGGGFGQLMRDTPIDPATLAQLTDVLASTYADYAVSQGLRFRSSSSVEDIEGFNGAGLYESSTGFLQPRRQTAVKDQKKSVEWALLRTWSSYWSFEAFEERHGEQIDHRSGGMAVLVHARFDDPLEVNNGVATLTLLPDGFADRSTAAINVQAGDVSVTNPGGGALPEVIGVRRPAAAAGSPTIDRVAASTLAPAEDVLDDAAVLELFGQLEDMTRLWRDRVNSSLPPEQRVETLTLDFEFRTMADGWPSVDGDERAGRLIVKQARSLEPGLRGFTEEVLALPLRRDVLARAQLVEEITCPTDGGSVVWFEATTDPLVTPDLGFSRTPFTTSRPDGVTADATCRRRQLHASPDRYLVELLTTGTPLIVTN